MARDTFDRLVLALNSLSKMHSGQVSNYRVQWNETIAKFVHESSAARYQFDKDAILRELIVILLREGEQLSDRKSLSAHMVRLLQ